jgi:DeoR/GlpR family transcriptional regulator of sugar metabolism
VPIEARVNETGMELRVERGRARRCRALSASSSEPGVMESPSKRIEPIPAMRRAMILERIKKHGVASIVELAEDINVSPSTVRRDLEKLTDEGYLERTHGGALLVRPLQATFEREPILNAHLNRDQKHAIGAEAALRLNTRESVIFDSSSTVMEAVRAAATRELSLTAVTNSLDIAGLCASVPAWRVILPGGSLRAGSRMIVGEPGEGFLKTIHADLCLIGAFAVTGNLLTDASLEVAGIKRAMIQSARRTILLVDSSKFQAPGFCTFCQLSEIDEVITDDGIDPEQIASLRASNVKLTIVPVPPSA